MNSDTDLDALFAEAAALRVQPSAALTSRILSDAAALQPQATQPVHRRRGWLAGLVDSLGGARALAGLSLAGLTGLFVGVAQPSGLSALTELWSAETSVEQMDLLPATDTLWTEN